MSFTTATAPSFIAQSCPMERPLGPSSLLRNVLGLTAVLALSACPLFAQRAGGGSAPSGGGTRTSGGFSGATAGSNGGAINNNPASPLYGAQPGAPTPYSLTFPDIPPIPRPSIVEDEACMPWSIRAIRGATVSVNRLEVPSNARGEYDKGCSAFKKKKFAEAEAHIRDAITKYSGYAAAWVMLGQTLAAENQMDKANDACSHALSIDANYVPPYLCLADLDAKDNLWDRLLDVSGRAVGLNPVGDAYAYYYQALAYFQMNKLPQAQKSASQAADIDQDHHQVASHYLLAQIYDAEGDLSGAVQQLKEFLKFNPDKDEANAAKEYLATLQAETPEKSASANP